MRGKGGRLRGDEPVRACVRREGDLTDAARATPPPPLLIWLLLTGEVGGLRLSRLESMYITWLLRGMTGDSALNLCTLGSSTWASCDSFPAPVSPLPLSKYEPTTAGLPPGVRRTQGVSGLNLLPSWCAVATPSCSWMADTSLRSVAKCASSGS